MMPFDNDLWCDDPLAQEIGAEPPDDDPDYLAFLADIGLQAQAGEDCDAGPETDAIPAYGQRRA